MIGLHFLFALGATIGFALIFNIPRKHILIAGLTGASGWLLYQFVISQGLSLVFACFAASCLVAACSELFARFFKEASLIFLIPGIIPLVPGAGMYATMLSLLREDLGAAAQYGIQTLLMTGSIAMAILTVSSLVRGLTAVISPYWD